MLSPMPWQREDRRIAGRRIRVQFQPRRRSCDASAATPEGHRDAQRLLRVLLGRVDVPMPTSVDSSAAECEEPGASLLVNSMDLDGDANQGDRLADQDESGARVTVLRIHEELDAGLSHVCRLRTCKLEVLDVAVASALEHEVAGLPKVLLRLENRLQDRPY